jgi:hypothetical protein
MDTSPATIRGDGNDRVMNSETERLPELLTNRISGNEELRLLSIGEIRARVERASPALETIAATVRNLESVDRNRSKSRKIAGMIQILGVFMFLWLIGGFVWRWLDFYQAGTELDTGMYGSFPPVPSVDLPDFLRPKPRKGPVGGRLDEDDALFLLWHAVECHWVKKDTLFDIIPEAGMTRIEHDHLTVIQNEFRKIRTGL